MYKSELIGKVQKTLEDRSQSYASPVINFRRIAKIWSVILNMNVLPQQVALCMIGLKLTREMHSHSEDNLVDICGYVACLEQIEDAHQLEVEDTKYFAKYDDEEDDEEDEEEDEEDDEEVDAEDSPLFKELAKLGELVKAVNSSKGVNSQYNG